ncbi:MAG: hypothetical protein ABEH58_01165 [Haloplanus sp.]
MINSDGSVDCPLCEHSVTTTADLRVHVMTHHRKSELTDEFLALVDEREDERELAAL